MPGGSRRMPAFMSACVAGFVLGCVVTDPLLAGLVWQTSLTLSWQGLCGKRCDGANECSKSCDLVQWPCKRACRRQRMPTCQAVGPKSPSLAVVCSWFPSRFCFPRSRFGVVLVRLSVVSVGLVGSRALY
jgi:hypothetical protein